MAKITVVGPSHADVAKESALLTKQGKTDPADANKLLEWKNWKAG